MEKRLDIMEIIQILWHRIIILIVGGLLGMIVAYSISAYALTPKYTSSIRLFVNNNTVMDGATSVASGDINASQQLVNNYIGILEDQRVLEEVVSRLNNTITVSELKSMISMSSVNNTAVLQIKATTDNPVLSARICNTIAGVAPEVLLRVIKAGSVEVVGDAVVPTSPSSPNIFFNTVIGTLLTLVLLIGIILVRELLDNTVKGEEELKEKYDISVLGEIPDFSNKKKPGRNKKAARLLPSITKLSKDTPFAIVEAYKTIRTNLDFAVGPYKTRIIEISSSIPEERKSTTSSNLATTIAQTGAKVLLIDGDLRKPTQHKIFKLDNAKGLTGILVDWYKIEQCLHKDVSKNLDVLTSGPIPPNPSELLGSANMKFLLDHVESKYDFIIIDTPPINVVTDAISLSKYTTGILLVTRQNYTNHHDLLPAINSIKFANANILGFVVTGWNDQTTNGFYYYRSYKYNYGN